MFGSDTISKVLCTVVTGIGTYLVKVLHSRSRKRQMREMLYREVSENYYKITVHIARCLSISGLSEGEPLRFAENLGLSFKFWNSYNSDESRKDLLFELKDIAVIASIYEKLASIGTDSHGYALVRGKVAAAEVDDSFLDGSLDRELYQTVSSKQAWDYIAILLNGERKSYRYYFNPLTRPVR
jgi:hypothetical protein